MGTFTYHIKVVANNACVTRDPAFDLLHTRNPPSPGNGDLVKFSSDDARTVIRYKTTSPFAEPELGPHKIFKIGKSTKGPFMVVTPDTPGPGHTARTHHFECGFSDDGVHFSPWGVLTPCDNNRKGDDTPADP